MRIYITIAFLLFAWHCISQTTKYYCPVNTSGGMTTKLEQWFAIDSAQVITKTLYKGKEKSLTYARVKSTNPDLVYITDGVVTSSLTIAEQEGRLSGIPYSVRLMFVPDIRSPNINGIFYCTASQ